MYIQLVYTTNAKGEEVVLDCVMRDDAAKQVAFGETITIGDRDLRYSISNTDQTVTMISPRTFRIDDTGEILTEKPDA